MAGRGQSDNYHEMSAQQAFDERRQADTARQDAMLDQIHNGVRGLKNQANAINGEVVEQNAMIDDIGGVSGPEQSLDVQRTRRLTSGVVCCSGWTMRRWTWSGKRRLRAASTPRRSMYVTVAVVDSVAMTWAFANLGRLFFLQMCKLYVVIAVLIVVVIVLFIIPSPTS